MTRRPSPVALLTIAFLLAAALLAGGGARSALAVAPGSPAAGAGVPAAQTAEQLFQDMVWRNIGPANMGGRVTDIEAVESDFKRVYVGTASGGVWRSDNAGNSWEPIFDDYEVVSVGDLAIFQPDPDIVWVGTGEANNRNSVSWGRGVYKSTDGGDTFALMGLEETNQIARVVTHPTDPDTVWVAAIGRLWGHTGERGLFKTTDGGETWNKLTNGLPDDGRTGATDLVIDPTDPDVLYVAFYERIRRPWRFDSGGPNGGIFKSTDGGDTWAKLSNGLPTGDTGRIGLAIYRSDPDIVMALIETQRPEGQDDESSDPAELARLGPGVYRSEDAGASWRYVNTYNNRPFYYSNIRINPQNDQRVYLLTTRFMVSEDGGKTLSNGAEDEEIHGDFHAMWLDPTDGDRYYVGQDKGAFLTQDHGAHFVMFDNMAIGQYYRVGVDMRDPYYVYGGLQDNGSWAGPSFSRDIRGILNDSNWKMHWGDGMYAQIDPTDWRKVYTEAENGSFRRYDPVTHETGGSTPNPGNVSNYVEVARAAVDDRGLSTTGGDAAATPQGGGRGGALSGATPEAQALARLFTREDPLFRFNWTAPMLMSHHDTSTLYLAGNYLFKTTDAGDSWTVISPDLSNNDSEERLQGVSGGLTPDNSGAETHATISTVSESPITPQVIWAGTDDGNVQVSRNGGVTWTNVRANVPRVPGGTWVSRVEASHFDIGAAYLSFDGHRSDDFGTYVFKTTDFGATWTDITSNLPAGHVVRVIRQDLRNPDLLFVGTEFGLFASIDDGASWMKFMNGMPTVPVYDLLIHPRDNDLIAGTHGRSIWIMDDITPLQQLTAEVRVRDGWLFEQRPATLWENVSRGGQRGHFWWAGENPATIEPTSSLARARFRNNALITFWVGADDLAPVLTITDGSGNRRRVELAPGAGIRRFLWDLYFDAPAGAEAAAGRGGRGFRGGPRLPEAGPGTYFLALTVGDEAYPGTLNVRPDPILTER